MALPLTTLTAQQAYQQLQSQGMLVKNMCASCQGASVPAGVLLNLLAEASNMLATAKSIAADTALTADVVNYVQSISGSTTVQADFDASLVAVGTLVAAIIKDYPVDASGHALDRIMDASGNITWLNFTQAQIPTTAPAIAAWLATVE